MRRGWRFYTAERSKTTLLHAAEWDRELAFLPISHSFVSPFQSRRGARASSIVHVITFYCGLPDYVASMSKHWHGLILCSFKSLGECAGLISASLLGLLSVSPPLGLPVYLDEGGTWLKHAVALTAVLGGQNVTSLEESKWEKLEMGAELISRGRKLTAQWLRAHSVFMPLLHCSVWMMQSPEWLSATTKARPLKPNSIVTGLSLKPQRVSPGEQSETWRSQKVW